MWLLCGFPSSMAQKVSGAESIEVVILVRMLCVEEVSSLVRHEEGALSEER